MPKRGVSKPVLIIGIALGVLLVIAASQHFSSSGKPTVKAQVTVTGAAVIVRNLDNFTWPYITLYVNGDPFSSGYKAIYNRAVAPREAISIPLMDNPKGQRPSVPDSIVNQQTFPIIGRRRVA
ncbi:MAG TPA: hypothetical protein VFU37_19960 [Pyrinomonadaceae bacterium]|nr:hypothetical protein [Pyrinomonadaceae bacterium]